VQELSASLFAVMSEGFIDATRTATPEPASLLLTSISVVPIWRRQAADRRNARNRFLF
jgi:hypothetical protein